MLAALVGGCASGPSAAVRDKRVCAAYEAFWDTDYSGGKPSATMLARERRLLDAIAHAPDEKPGAAAKAVIDGELTTPPFRPGETSKQYAADLRAITPDERR